MTTKEKILMATLELAAEKGLGSVSLSQIAQKVGIQKPSLYNHFSSKEEIIDGLYEYLRSQAKENVNGESIDYGKLVKGKKPYNILSDAVNSYIMMNQDSNINQFYRFVMSERSISKEAAKIMVAETEKMVLSTKQLFYAMQVQHVMEFEDIDAAAFAFAMSVHSIMDYIRDQSMAGTEATAEQMLKEYLRDFCRVYAYRSYE